MKQFSFSTKSGIAGGTLMGILVNINSHDTIKTAALAAVSAAVSGLISTFLKFVLEKIKQPGTDDKVQ